MRMAWLTWILLLASCSCTWDGGGDYSTFDQHGYASWPGEYTFLLEPYEDSIFASPTVAWTYDQLRTEATVLRVSFEDDPSLAAFLDTVEVGDIVEWRQSDSCWARYAITALLPPTGRFQVRDFGVKAYTWAPPNDFYVRAFDPDCSGYVVWEGPRSTHQINWPSRDLSFPSSLARHGVWMLYPLTPESSGGASSLPPPPVFWPDFVLPDHIAEVTELPCRGDDAYDDVDLDDYSYNLQILWRDGELPGCDRVHPWWRDAAVPEGWTFDSALWYDDPIRPVYGYFARYLNEHGEVGLRLSVTYHGRVAGQLMLMFDPAEVPSGWSRAARIVDGHHAIVGYSERAPEEGGAFLPVVELFNAETRMHYSVVAEDDRLDSNDVLEIALSLAQGESP